MKLSIKKVIGAILVIATISTSMVFAQTVSAASMGDVNGDGQITPYDATMILRYVEGRTSLTTTQRKNADVSADSEVDKTDAQMILEYVAGKIKAFGALPTKITLTQNSVAMRVGQTLELGVKFTPSNATSSITWSSNDTDVATVDDQGKVKARSSGTAIITAKTSNNLKAKCAVTVGNSQYGNTVYLSPSNQTANLYSYGGTSEGVQMRLVGAVVEQILKDNDIDVIVADPNMSITNRAKEANELGVGLYVAIHSNAGASGRGTEAFYHPDRDGGKELAQSVYNAVARLTPTPDRGIKDGMAAFSGVGYAEIREPQMAATLVEVEFHDKADLAKWIMDNIDGLGEAIAEGIMDYMGK